MLVVRRVAAGRVGSPAGLVCARFGATDSDDGGLGSSLRATDGDGDGVEPADGAGESVGDADGADGSGDVGSSLLRYLSSE